MFKKDLVNLAAEIAGTTKKDMTMAFEAIEESFKRGLLSEGKVSIRGIGTFEITERAARIGRNPQTGESIEIPAKNVVRFKPSSTLKEEIQ